MSISNEANQAQRGPSFSTASRSEPAEARFDGTRPSWLLKHRGLWTVAVVLVGLALILAPSASFVLTAVGGEAAVNAVLAFFVISVIWLLKRNYEIVEAQREQFSMRARNLEASMEALVPVLRSAMDLRDPTTSERAAQMNEIMTVLAGKLGLRQQQLRDMMLAATLHDVGKLGVAEALLARPDPLDDDEWANLKAHPAVGFEMLQRVGFLDGFLEGAAEVILCHHERHDGAGYPRGLAEEEIPLPARVYAVVDAYGAITSDRPYRRARSHREAVQEIERGSGTQFDPAVVRAFLAADKQGLIDRPDRDRIRYNHLREILSQISSDPSSRVFGPRETAAGEGAAPAARPEPGAATRRDSS